MRLLNVFKLLRVWLTNFPGNLNFFLCVVKLEVLNFQGMMENFGGSFGLLIRGKILIQFDQIATLSSPFSLPNVCMVLAFKKWMMPEILDSFPPKV